MKTSLFTVSTAAKRAHLTVSAGSRANVSRSPLHSCPLVFIGGFRLQFAARDFWRTLLFLPTLLAGGLAFAFADQVSDNDVLFKALGDELKRSMSLRLEDLDQPYFIQYAVDDSVTYRIAAGQGGLLSSDQSRSRVLHSQVRVGSYELDNSNFTGRGGAGGRRGLSGSTELPTDDDYMALRHAIWLATDSQFKEAVEALTQKRA